MEGSIKIVESTSQWESKKKILNEKTHGCLILSCSGLAEFYENLLKETPKKLLCDNLAINLIRSIAKDSFSQERSLNSLMLSSKFFLELYKLFSKFSENLITPQELKLHTKSLAAVDCSRMNTIADVFEQYLKILEKNNFVTPATAPEYLSQNSLAAYDSLLMDAPDGISPAQKILFEKIFKKITVYTVKEHLITPEVPVSAEIFEDIVHEIETIGLKIKSDVQKNGTSYNDYAVLTYNQTLKNKISDIFKSLNVPITPESNSDNFKNFKNSLIRYFNIFSVFQRLGLENLSKEEFERANYESKAFVETAYAELNIYIESMLNEFAPESKDRFLSMTDASASLLSTINSNIDLADNAEQPVLKKMLEDIRKYYGAFKNNKITGIINAISENYNPEKLKNTLNILLASIKETTDFYENILNDIPDIDILTDIIRNLNEDTSENIRKDAAVTIAPYTSNQKYKHVIIPALIEDAVPSSNNAISFISPFSEEKLTNQLKAKHADFDFLIKPDKIQRQDEHKKFLNALCCAQGSIVISTHTYKDKKQCNPSPYFNEILNLFKITPRKNATNKNFSKLKLSCTAQSNTKSGNVIEENEVLKLNPSAITGYQSCPRKFYFKNLLNLKEQSAFAANYGTIVHAIFEVLNNKGKNFYNKETCLALKNILFNSIEDAQSALEAGFKQIDIDLIKASDKLSLKEMENNFDDAVENLENSGFFIGKPDAVLTETTFHFELEQIKNVIFDGRIDAILKKDGEYTVIDYKTGADKENSLEYAMSENGVNFLTKTGKPPSNPQDYEKKYDYQIPLYYLACENAPELESFKGQLCSLGLQYIRPASKNGGCKSDMIEAERIEAKQEKIIDNLKKTIIDKIRTTNRFEKNESWNCSECTFSFLCDCEDDTDE